MIYGIPRYNRKYKVVEAQKGSIIQNSFQEYRLSDLKEAPYKLGFLKGSSCIYYVFYFGFYIFTLFKKQCELWQTPIIIIEEVS